MSGFAKGFGRVSSEIREQKFKAEEAEKQRQADSDRLTQQYKLQFQNNVNFAIKQRQMNNDQITKDATAWYEATTKHKPGTAKYTEGLQNAINTARSHGSIANKLKFDQKEREIETKGLGRAQRAVLIPGTNLQGIPTRDGFINPDTGVKYTNNEIKKSKEDVKRLDITMNENIADSKEVNKMFNETRQDDFETIQNYDTLIHQIDTADTGALAEIGFQLSRYAKSLGIPVDEDILTARGQLKVAKMKSLVTSISQYPGAMSNKEMDAFTEITPNIENETAMNRFIVNSAYATAAHRDWERGMVAKIKREKNLSASEARAELDLMQEDINNENYRPFVSTGPNRIIDKSTGTPMLYAVYEHKMKNDYPGVTSSQIKERWMQNHYGN